MKIFEYLKTSHLSYPTYSISQLLLYPLAALTAIASLAPVIVVLAIIFFVPKNFFSIFLSVALLGLAWLVRPRLSAPPGDLVPPSRCPTLWDCVRQVSERLGVMPPDGLQIDGRFNACIGRYGLSQRRILTLGLPLMMALDKQERIALIAHEMSHCANRDPARGVAVSITISSLAGWHEALYPLEIWPRESGQNILVMVGTAISNLAMLAVSQIPLGLLWLAVHLHWDASQVAEYRADRLAAQVSGVAAFDRMLSKSLIAPQFDFILRRNFLNGKVGTLFSDIARYVETLPPRELDRLHRLSSLEQTRLDRSHPPTAWRKSMIRSGDTPPQILELADQCNQRIDEELRPLSDQIERQLFDDYQSSLYA